MIAIRLEEELGSSSLSLAHLFSLLCVGEEMCLYMQIIYVNLLTLLSLGFELMVKKLFLKCIVSLTVSELEL